MDQFRAPRPAVNALRVLVVLLCLVLCFVPSLGVAASKAQAGAKPTDQSVSLNQLADILENDKTRAQLISQLRQAAAQSGHEKPGQAGGKAEAPPTKSAAHQPAASAGTAAAGPKQAAAHPERASFARHFAQMTATWAETVGAQINSTWHLFTSTAEGRGKASGPSFNARAFFDASITFLAVALSTVVVFFVLRLLAGTIFSLIGRFAEKAETGSSVLVRRGSAIIMAIIVDVAVVLLAVGAGYLVGLFVFGQAGAMGTRESLFINAFALVELIKVAIRALFAARYDGLRLLNIPSSVAGWWSIRLRWFVGVIGYALLVVVPIINAQLSFFIGAIITFLVMGGAYVYALGVIFKNRKLFTQRLMEMGEKATVGFFSVLYRLFARLWMVIAVVYFTVLFVASQLDPATALPFMMTATLETLAVAAIGFAISGLLSRAVGRRVRFSDSLREKLPMLEARVNSYVPNALQVIRVVILLLVAAEVANAWHVFNFGAWLASDAGLTTISIAIKVAIILTAAALLWMLTASIIEYRLSPNTGQGAPSARQQTLLVLFRNALAVLIATMTLMIALSQIGVNIGPLIAGAGVFGLAIGFGAQKLVQDVITGVFIQLENAMNTGDVVSVGGITGTAERLTIRSVSIRDIDGAYHLVPFSSASVVTNYMRDWAYFRTEYGIAYREDIDNAIAHLREAFADLKSDPVAGPNILEDMTVPGVTALGDSSVNIRIMIKTKPGTQWGVGRAFNRLVKIHFDRAGIEIPFPHQTLYFGEDRSGNAPPANLRIIEALPEEEQQPRRLKKKRRGDDPAPEETGDAPSGS